MVLTEFLDSVVVLECMDLQACCRYVRVMKVDMIQGKIRVSLWFRLKWIDPRLSFNGTDHFGSIWLDYNRVPLSTARIWTPDIYLLDATQPFQAAWTADTMASLYDKTVEAKDAYNIFWSRPGILEAHCKMDLKMFPFDVQMCDFVWFR